MFPIVYYFAPHDIVSFHDNEPSNNAARLMKEAPLVIKYKDNNYWCPRVFMDFLE